jgi:hypothetical protein
MSIMHKKSRMALIIKGNNPTVVTLERRDPIGNLQERQEFTGPENFWKAVAIFEKKIEAFLGVSEVLGFEIGMVIQLTQDYGEYQKGTIVQVDEIDENGKAKKYTVLNAKQLSNVKNFVGTVEISKAVGLEEIFNNKHITNLKQLKSNADYNFGLEPGQVLEIPDSYELDEFEIGQKVVANDHPEWGVGTIKKFLFITDENKRTKLAGIVIFENEPTQIMLDKITSNE